MPRKFKKRAFKVWLDELCKVVVKTRDGYRCCKCKKLILDRYNCQWCHIKSRKSNALRWDLLNAQTLCGTCHSWCHDNPDEAWQWLPQYQLEYLIKKQHEPARTWHEPDFLAGEAYLLDKAVEFDVDPINIGKRYRKRLIRKLEGK